MLFHYIATRCLRYNICSAWFLDIRIPTCCLRGGQEQRNLKLSQVRRETSILDGKELSLYVYCEFESKNRQGGLSSFNLQNKVVRQYENTTESGVCHVKILDKYLEILPPDAVDQDAFYLTPLPKVPADPTKPWFKAVPVGKNRLNVMLKEYVLKLALLPAIPIIVLEPMVQQPCFKLVFPRN